MGARQSTPTDGEGGGSVSSSSSPRLFGGHPPGSSGRPGPDGQRRGVPSAIDIRQRARSLSSVMAGAAASAAAGGHSSLVSIPGLPFGLASGSPDSDTSNEDMDASFGRGGLFSAHSLPVQIVPFNGIKCPVCNKTILTDDVEVHLVMCLTKPRIGYNEDILTEDKGECVICLDDMAQGQTIARLPCLCIYHKNCIEDWFKVNRSCPEHPQD